jgi:DNA-binding response OmpR family regulator
MSQTILLVEDDEAVATVVLRIMRRLDASVEHVGTGHDALARIGRGGVDLVLLDLGLPDLDGAQVCELARTGGYTGPVLVLTARHGPGPRDQALGAGANAYLNKPFSIVDLMARVRPLLRDGPEGAPIP